MLSGYPLNDLVRLAAAGAGFELDAHGYVTNDLIRIAAASSGKGTIRFVNLLPRDMNDLIRIAAAGGGSSFIVS